MVVVEKTPENIVLCLGVVQLRISGCVISYLKLTTVHFDPALLAILIQVIAVKILGLVFISWAMANMQYPTPTWEPLLSV